jgi:ubiquinone/menaquinone biosynthesis C-methylase UbiE
VHLGAYKHNKGEKSMQTSEQLKSIVKEKYGSIAKQATTGCGCGCDGGNENPLSTDYSHVEGHYAKADLGLGCGIPTQFAQIDEGHVVLDLGSGAGNDVFVVRPLVGESGKIIGVDMTEKMIARAQQNQKKLGYQNVEFRLGDIEKLPVNSDEVDVVISNCVLNLVLDKRKAFQEIYRVLKPGGHFCISDIVLQGKLPETLKSLAEMYAGCVAGAMQRDDYLHVIQETGFAETEVKKEHQVRISDALLAEHLSDDEMTSYQQSNTQVLSITVFGKKPVNPK